MYSALTIILISLGVNCFSQVEFYSCSESGELIISSTEDCSINSLGYYTQFSDIAFTPDGTLYGVSDYIYKINTNLQTYTAVSLPFGLSAPTGFVAIDNDNLLFDIDDSLFIFNISSSNVNFLGVIGYYCNGDFAIFEEDLYMISGSNNLIKIVINFEVGYIESVENIGEINSPGLSYSLFTAYNSCNIKKLNLYLIDSDKVYQIDALNANATLKCSLGSNQNSLGAASIKTSLENINYNNPPNVFTPNNDLINDTFHFKTNEKLLSFTIFNRWGNIIYKWDSNDVLWDGTNFRGNNVSEGVYFYSMKYIDCNKVLNKTGHITLVR